MPRKATKKVRRSSRPPVNDTGQARIPSVMRSAEALSVGAVRTLTGTAVTAIRGIQKVGAEVASSAVSAVRGTIRAAGGIGAVPGNTSDGPKARVATRVGSRPAAASAASLARKPLRKASARPRRRRRRSVA
jgi:hypothetical protein